MNDVPEPDSEQKRLLAELCELLKPGDIRLAPNGQDFTLSLEGTRTLRALVSLREAVAEFDLSDEDMVPDDVDDAEIVEFERPAHLVRELVVAARAANAVD